MTEETLFDQARQLPAAERAAFLDRECAGQADLRARVEALLAADVVSHCPLDHPMIEPERTGPYVPAPEDEPPPVPAMAESRAGMVIAGKYTLVDGIGEGGRS